MATKKSTDLQIGTDVLIDTPLKAVLCGRCRQLTVQGEVTGFTLQFDPWLLTLDQELEARIQGRRCFELEPKGGRLYAQVRDVHRITKKRHKHDPEPAVVAEHRHDQERDTDDDQPPF